MEATATGTYSSRLTPIRVGVPGPAQGLQDGSDADPAAVVHRGHPIDRSIGWAEGRDRRQGTRRRCVVTVRSFAAIAVCQPAAAAADPRPAAPTSPWSGPLWRVRNALNMISAVTPKGRLRFSTFTGSMTAKVFLDFVKRLLHDEPNPVFLIVDGHPVRRSKAVKTFVDSTQGRLRLFFLPPYSPELNPDEWVWKNVKTRPHRQSRLLRPAHPIRPSGLATFDLLGIAIVGA